jgi:hypothetical protein
MRQLTKNLARTYIFSLVISLIFNLVYYAVVRRAADYANVIPLAVVGELFITLIITIMTLPVLFLSNPKIWNNLISRRLLYFSGPFVFIIGALTAGLQEGDFEFYLFTGIIFLIVHTIYYFRLGKKTHEH